MTHSCAPSAAASTPSPPRPTCNDRPSTVYVDDAKRSLTLLHLAGRTCGSASILLKELVPSFPSSPPPLSRPRAGGRNWLEQTETNLPFRQRQLPSSFPPALVVALAVSLPGPPHGALSVLTAVFSGHSVQMPLIWSPLSQRQHHSAVIHQRGGNAGPQPIRCPDSQTSANHRHALSPSDGQRG